MKKFAIVDIETNSAKVLFANIGRTIEIENAFEESIPKEVKSLEDKKIFLKEKLSDIFQCQMDLKNIIILAKGTDVVIRNYSFPVTSKSQLQEAVKWKIIEHSHLNEEEVLFNYCINKKAGYRYNARSNVTAAAASPAVIKKYHDFFSYSGYRTPSLSLEAEGIRGIALSLGDQALKDKITAVMHIGQFLTNVVILKGGFLTASRVIPTADENFSRVLVGETIVDGKTVNVTHEQAAIVKKDIGIPMGDSETSAYAKILPPSTITQMLQPLLGGFVSEIERFFKFFRTETQTERIDEILLSGPGTSLKNIDAYFEKSFKIPTRFLNIQTQDLISVNIKDPEKKTSFQQNMSSFSPLIGSLVCLLKESSILKIYEPPGVFDKVFSFARKLYTLFIGLIFLIGYIIILGRSIEMRNSATELEGKWRNMMTTYHGFFTLQGERTNLNRTLVSFNELKKSTYLPWLSIFQDISLRTPEKLTIWTLKAGSRIASNGEQQKVMEIKGFVFDAKGHQEEIITQFIIALNQSKYFKHVDITYTEKDIMESELTHFEIIAQIVTEKSTL